MIRRQHFFKGGAITTLASPLSAIMYQHALAKNTWISRHDSNSYFAKNRVTSANTQTLCDSQANVPEEAHGIYALAARFVNLFTTK
jgi:hypothetical protein